MSNMSFEVTMRLFFGDKAAHIASSFSHSATRRQWLRKTNKKIDKQIENVDSTERHRSMMDSYGSGLEAIRNTTD